MAIVQRSFALISFTQRGQEFWAKIPSTVAGRTCWPAAVSVGKGHSTPGGITIWAPQSTNGEEGKLAANLNANTDITTVDGGMTVVTDDRWHHVALVKHGSASDVALCSQTRHRSLTHAL